VDVNLRLLGVVTFPAGQFGMREGVIGVPGESGPRSRRCVVIGAGVLGAYIAARLAEAGAGVTLLGGPARPRGHPVELCLAERQRQGASCYHDLNHAGMRAGLRWRRAAAARRGAAGGNIEWAASAPRHARLAARVRARRARVPGAPDRRRAGG
jgi:choline dehydrogenase-like flavoprotein